MHLVERVDHDDSVPVRPVDFFPGEWVEGDGGHHLSVEDPCLQRQDDQDHNRGKPEEAQETVGVHAVSHGAEDSRELCLVFDQADDDNDL